MKSKYVSNKRAERLVEIAVDRLKQSMIEAEITAYYLAKRSGITRAGLSYILKGKTEPNCYTIDKLSRAMDIYPVSLFQKQALKVITQSEMVVLKRKNQYSVKTREIIISYLNGLDFASQAPARRSKALSVESYADRMMRPLQIRISERVRQLMVEHSITKTHLIAKTAVSVNGLNSLLRAKNFTGMYILGKIMVALNCNNKEIFGLSKRCQPLDKELSILKSFRSYNKLQKQELCDFLRIQNKGRAI